ncbi:hypothetical protein [Chamaesiphon sp. OTE_75_metabat_556]|uniref:hypothetical protein n=1 Tax=Chamaesiphon sp. OTE_75_metabat_556 TaxID=2964692 RepID=UPI00286C65E0|nr:hypothetical protein [Chamaesiphon sp. OTE_75_metabat_556]
MSVDIQIGSIVYGRSGNPLRVASVDKDLVLIAGESGYRKIHRSAILKVESPQISNRIQIGDRVWRNSHSSPKYPQAWFRNGVNKIPSVVPAIESATVERFSLDDVWIKTKNGELYHVTRTAFEIGNWGWERTHP